MNKMKKTLSIFLAVMMIISSLSVIFAFAANTKSSVTAATDIVISVPETVYMTPQNNYGTATTSVKYYVNNTVSTSGAITLDKENSKTVGKFYIYSTQISSVTSVSTSGATLSSFSTSTNGSLFYDDSFTMTLSSGISSSKTKTIEWTITCKMKDNSTATFYAYTVAYNPYLSPVFAAGRCKNTRGDNSFGSGMSWVSGIHGISTGGGYYPYNSFLPVYDGSHPTNGNGKQSPDIRFNSSQQCGLPTKGGWYTSKEYGYNYGDETLCVFERSAEAYINVDTSRYDNLNQIPNLTCGLWVSDAEGISNNNVYGYVGKLTNASDRITSGRNWYTRSNTSPSEWNASVSIWGGDRSTGRTNNNYKLTNVRMNMSVPSGWIYIRGALKTASGGDNCFCILDNYLNVVQVNKSSWRTAINNAQKYGFQRSWNTSNFDTWKAKLKAAYEALGNPTNTSYTTSNLTDATSTMANSAKADAWANDYGLVKVLDDSGNFNNKWTVSSLNTNSLSSYYGSKLTFTKGSYDYRTFIGSEKCVDAQTSGTVTSTAANLATTLGTVTTSPIDVFFMNPTTVSNGDHRRVYYFKGNDVNVTINPNGGLWNGSSSNSTITGSYSGTFSPKNPTKAYDSSNHYSFNGWELVSGSGGSLSGSTYTFGSSAGTLKAKWTSTAHNYTSSVTTQPTCTNTGVTTYTCSCGRSYTSNTPAASGHSWGTPTYSWSGTSSCTGTRTCSRDGSHTDTATATISSTVKTAPTCTTKGTTTYTATFSNSAYSTQTKDVQDIAKNPSNHASYGETLDESTKREPTYDSAGYTGDKKCDGCGAVRTLGEAIPKLEDLISLDAIKLEDTALSGSCSIAPSVHENDISYEIVGFSATGDHTLYKSSNKPDDGETLKLSNARIRKTSDSSFSYKFSSMDFTNLESFYVLVKVSGTNLHKYSVNDIYTYEKVTLVPPKNVMFDDASPAISFNNSSAENSGYGQWVRIADSGSPVSSPAALDEFGDLATAQQSTENSVRYSFGDAHRVSVSNTIDTDWPTAQFTFTGSGFDVISVTDSNSGIFGVKVYQGTDTNVEKPYKSKIVDTYYGYTYTQLFYNQRTHKIVNSADSNGTVLYAAVSTTPEANRVYGGIGTYFYTMDEQYAVKDNQNNPVIAYGWLKSTSSDVLYQVPCLNMDLGEVGTYTVIIQPMFTDALGHYNQSGDVKYYNFTLDGIRIYNPAGGNSEALAMYDANGETYTSYELVRGTINDASLVVIDGKDQLDEQQLPGYLAGAPKNELYLKKSGTAAFDVNFTNLTDAKLGLRALNGVSSSVIISNGTSTITVNVTSATEQYVSLKPLLTSGSSSTITVTNGGDGILSITRLMTTTNTAPPSPSGAPRRYLSVGPNTAQVALETVEMLNADIAIDEETVETTSTYDGTVTITLQTGEDAETIVIRDAEGNVVDPDSIEFTIDEEGIKNWTIVLTESESGEYTYTLQAEYENGYTGETEPTTVTVTVSFPEPEDTSIGGRLDKIKGFFERLIEFIRRIIKLFR